jgi:chromate transporter
MGYDRNNTRLSEIAALFLKLGIIGFGGPAVHISMMEEEVVRKRKWMDHQHFLDLVGATNLIPGPNSTEMTMHIGRERAGWKGLIVAGSCFILPAVIITAIFAWAYKRYGTIPEVEAFIYGIKPAIISVLVSLVYRLGKNVLKTFELWFIGIAVATLAIIGINEIYLLFAAGAIGALLHLAKHRAVFLGMLPFTFLQVGSFSLPPTNWKLFLIFLKIGSILYGSGYVLFPFLDSELVEKGLLSQKELTDAIAVGQFTPGPVFSSATFIGWQMANLPGAIAATAGIFLPSFLFVALLNPLIPRLRRSKLISAFLDAVNVASIALILAICVKMSGESIQDWRTIIIAVVGFLVAIFFRKINTAFIIAGGGLLGFLLSLF